jgi:hypothetical protein
MVIVASMDLINAHEELNERHADLVSRATASNSCRKKYRAFKTVFGLHPISQGSLNEESNAM